LAVSAKTGAGLADLKRRVVEQVAQGGAIPENYPVLTSVRHRDALLKAGESLHLARESICDGRPADLVAVDVQDSLDYVGGITGAVTSEEVLDRIFGEFCIGK